MCFIANFLQYKKNGCTIQPVGKTRLEEFSERYTDPTFWKTFATVVADSGADITSIKRHGRWKSASAAES